MAVLALVEHFLDDEGQRRFPASLQRVADEASRYEGFVSLRQLRVPDDPSACLMLLEFADPVTLRRWVESPERAQILAEQEPHRVRELQSRRFFVESPLVPTPQR
jgi:antibiotic biosynthesis monooxygenase (ABM) superfamily enzyme